MRTIFFDTFISAIFDEKAQVVRGTLGKFNFDSTTEGPDPVVEFVIPAYHFMQQAVFLHRVALNMAAREPRLNKHLLEMQAHFRGEETDD